jgi:hypothetical protein
MSDIEERAKDAAAAPENAAQRDRNQRIGVDDDEPAGNEHTEATADPRDTDHPVGTDQAKENEENDPPS